MVDHKQLIDVIESLQIQDDFADLLDYAVNNKIKLTKSGNMGPKDCFAINQLLYHGRDVPHNKVLHPNYPAVWFLFHIGLESGLLIRKIISQQNIWW